MKKGNDLQEIAISKIDYNTGQVPGLPANPRFIRNENFELLRQSLKESSEMLEMRPPILFPLSGRYVVVAGEMRTRAAVSNGAETIKAKILPAKTSAQDLIRIAIKDNINAGEWDMEKIEGEWAKSNDLNSWGLFWYNEVDETTDEPDFDQSAESYINSSTRQIVLVYSNMEHPTVVAQLKNAQTDFDCENISMALIKLIDFYNANN